MGTSKHTSVAYSQDGVCSGESFGFAGMLRHRHDVEVSSSLRSLTGLALAEQEETYATKLCTNTITVSLSYYLLFTFNYNGAI